MKNINWKVRLKNKNFWLSMIPAAIVLIQYVAKLLGIEIDLSEVGANLLNFVNVVFVVLAILGIVVDPTTQGFTDSEQAMLYETPKEDL